MKCKQCGVELEDGAVFCQSCGAKVEAPAEEKPAEEPKAEEKPAEESKAEEKPAEEAPKAEEKAAEAPKAEEAAPAASQPQPQAQPAPQAAPAGAAPEKKSKILPIILIAAAALVVVILAIVGIKALGGGKKGDTSTVVAYVSRDTLCVITDATAKEPKILEVCDLDIDQIQYDGSAYIPDTLVKWSEDEKTLYFFNDLEEDGYATLCKVEVSKLGKDKSKNESKVVEIDDKVQPGSFRFLDGGRIAYLTSKDKLMVYNGKESVEVEKDVQSVRTVNDGKGLLLLMDMDDNGNYTLTYADSKLNTTEIDDDVRFISTVTDDMIYYVKVDDDWQYSVIACGFDGKNSVEISDNYSSMGSITDNGFYYTEELDEEVCLYDYIIDPYAEDDENVVEPTYPERQDAFVESDSREAFDESTLKRIDKNYGGDYIEYIEDYCYSSTYGDKTYYSFYNYDSSEYFYYDASADKFYRYDEDLYEDLYNQYYEDRDAYYEIQNRIYLRESLKEYSFNLGYVSLNYYHDGKSEELVPECVDVELLYLAGKNPVAVYSLPTDDSVEKIKIDDITYAYEAYDQIFGRSDSSEFGELFVAVGSETGISLDIEASISDIIASEDDGLFAIVVYTKNKKEEYEKQILLYDWKGTSFTLNEKFDDEAEALSAFKNGVVYFMKGTNNDGTEADLYIYDGKENTKLIKNVSLYFSGLVYDNGSIIVYDDADAVLYDKNGQEIVKLGYIDSLYSDINHISDKKIVFFSEGKLNYFNGKETVKIAKSVDNVWFNSSSGATYLSMR